MVEFIAGVIVGAVFAPFWLKLWNVAKDKLGFNKE
jgi:F0F1-type ATP synthase assembly protein I